MACKDSMRLRSHGDCCVCSLCNYVYSQGRMNRSDSLLVVEKALFHRKSSSKTPNVLQRLPETASNQSCSKAGECKDPKVG